MIKRYVPVATMAALLTGAASVAQPQTTDTNTTTGTATQTTPSASTPATNPGSTTTGTASDTSTGSQGMHGGFRGTTPGTTTDTGTGTTTGSTSDGSTTGTAYGTTEGTTGTSTYGTTRDTTATGTSSGATATTTTDADAATSNTSAYGTTRETTAAAATGAGTNALQGQDAAFLRRALESDRIEIAQAQAALENAQRSDTRNAAQMILDDHRQSTQKLQELASRKGWTLPNVSTTAESDQSRMSTAGAGTGSFDDRFFADQIRAHREAIDLYRAQATGGSDPDLRQFARDQLPHLEHHLEMLQGANTQK